MVTVHMRVWFAVATCSVTTIAFAACGTFSGSSSGPVADDSATLDARDTSTGVDAGALGDEDATGVNDATASRDALADAPVNLVQNAALAGSCSFWLSDTVGVTTSATSFDGSVACALCANGGNAFAYQRVMIPVAQGDTFNATTQLEAPGGAGFVMELGVDLYAKGTAVDTLNATPSSAVSGVEWIEVEDPYSAPSAGDELRFMVAFGATNPAGTCVLVADSTLVKTN